MENSYGDLGQLPWNNMVSMVFPWNTMILHENYMGFSWKTMENPWVISVRVYRDCIPCSAVMTANNGWSCKRHPDDISKTKTANITKDDVICVEHRRIYVTVLRSNIICCDICCCWYLHLLFYPTRCIKTRSSSANEIANVNFLRRHRTRGTKYKKKKS